MCVEESSKRRTGTFKDAGIKGERADEGQLSVFGYLPKANLRRAPMPLSSVCHRAAHYDLHYEHDVLRANKRIITLGKACRSEIPERLNGSGGPSYDLR